MIKIYIVGYFRKIICSGASKNDGNFFLYDIKYKYITLKLVKILEILIYKLK